MKLHKNIFYQLFTDMELQKEQIAFENLIDRVFDKSEAFQEFFSQGQTLNAIISKKGKFLYVNKRWEEVLGFSPQELTSSPLKVFVHKEDVNKSIYGGESKIIRYRTRSGKFVKVKWITASESKNKKYWLATGLIIE